MKVFTKKIWDCLLLPEVADEEYSLGFLGVPMKLCTASNLTYAYTPILFLGLEASVNLSDIIILQYHVTNCLASYVTLYLNLPHQNDVCIEI